MSLTRDIVPAAQTSMNLYYQINLLPKIPLNSHKLAKERRQTSLSILKLLFSTFIVFLLRLENHSPTGKKF